MGTLSPSSLELYIIIKGAFFWLMQHRAMVVLLVLLDHESVCDMILGRKVASCRGN